ncbi:MAG: CHRD domain-containing protein [Thermoleophilaceae bacterium]
MKNRRVIAALAVALLTGVGVAVALGAQSETSQQTFRAGFGVLKGANEVGDGDRNGRGSFTGIIDGNRLCFGIAVANIADPIAAHIHRGAKGVDGGVVVTLKHPRKGDPGASHGCTGISSSLADELRSNPNGFYVNVHNEPFPDGAVRGQIFNRAG